MKTKGRAMAVPLIVGAVLAVVALSLRVSGTALLLSALRWCGRAI